MRCRPWLLMLTLAACAPADPALETVLAPVARTEAAASGTAAAPGASGGGAMQRPPMPAWDPRQRVPNFNARVLTNNVYGPGRSSDRYGAEVHHNPGLRIEESALGAGDYTDQYGRAVRCYGSGMGTFCQ